MMLDQRSAFSSYLTRLLSHGQVTFTAAQAQLALGISQSALLSAAEKQQKRGNLLKPRRGFYVIVAPQYLSWGAPPPSWYIDALMLHQARLYYVGLLKAAELNGATHQAVMEFQIVTDKQMRRIKAGRSALAFYYRKDMAAISAGIEDHKTDTGSMKVSGAELTALDLLRYPHGAGGLDHIVTVLTDLGERIDGDKLAALASTFERAVLQRLGFLLGYCGQGDKADPLHALLDAGSSLPWVELEPALAGDPDFAPDVVERSKRWHVIGRRAPEADT